MTTTPTAPPPVTPQPRRPMSGRRRAVLTAVVVAALGGAGLVGLAACTFLTPVPAGVVDPRADALARQALASIHVDKWEQTGALRFTFRGGRKHLWDRTRGFLRFTEGEQQVDLDLWDQGGVVRAQGVVVEDIAARNKALARAWSAYINDTYWLNPVAHLFDTDTERLLVKDDDGHDAVLLQFGRGGVTPGDAYLWLLDESGQPRAWRMWVSVLPLKGVEWRIAGWKTLATGARVIADHAGPAGAHITFDDVEGAFDLASLLAGAPDPFTELVSRRAALASSRASLTSSPSVGPGAGSDAGPSSQPAGSDG